MQRSNNILKTVVLFLGLLFVTPSALAQTISPLSCSISGSTITCGGTSITPASSSLTSGHLFVGDVTNTAADVALSGDATLANTGAITVTKSGGISFKSAAFALTGTTGATVPYFNGTNTWSAVNTYSANTVFGVNGAVSVPAVAITGTISNVGSATTNKPLVLIEAPGTTSTAWSTAGTGLAVNAASAFTGNMIDLQLNGSSKFLVSSSGTTLGAALTYGGVTLSNAVTGTGNMVLSASPDFSGTVTGATLTFTAAIRAGAGSTLGFTGRTVLYSPADSTLVLSNNAVNDFGRLQWGGTTSSFPSLKRSGTALQVRLADDSGDAAITAAALTATTAFMYFTGLSTDSGIADSTMCVATTSGQIYKGSGVAGICLGTSSIRYKHDIKPLTAGLNEIMGLRAVSYVPNNQDKVLYGFTAEQGGTVLPQLMGRDSEGRPNTFDYLGVVPVLVRAIQEQQKQIDELKSERASNPH